MTLYFLCPDKQDPIGGIRKIYRSVDILNDHGFSACVLHNSREFRVSWFRNQTRVLGTPDVSFDADDILVFPEQFGPRIAAIAPGLRKVIFVQGCYLTFRGYSHDPNDFTCPYYHPDILGAVVVSEDSRRYLGYIFPRLRIARIRNGIDTALFSHHAEKRARLAYLTYKNPEDLTQVLNILKFSGHLAGFELCPIEGMREEQVAELLKETAIFLSFSGHEGFSLPPAEAMARGAVVAGYDGWGGKEYFRPEFCHPVPYGDILAYADTVKGLIAQWRRDPAPLLEQGRRASSFIHAEYSPRREEESVVAAWGELLENAG